MRAISVWYAASHGAHYRNPNSVRVAVRILSGGGGGMGSRPNMDFSESDPPYALYGGVGGPSCWDTLPTNFCVNLDGVTFAWANHPLHVDNPVFFSANQGQLWYVFGPSMTEHTFQLSAVPYSPPRPGFIDYVPHQFGPGVYQVNAYRYAVLGGGRGGVVGDQPIPGQIIGLDNNYFYGSCGDVALGAGGRGGDSPLGGGACAQVGGSNGNDGNNNQGGGGSGAGFYGSDGLYPKNQYGPSGGAGGTMADIECELKPFYNFHAGMGGVGGMAGAGGWRGGNGGNGIIIVREYF